MSMPTLVATGGTMYCLKLPTVSSIVRGDGRRVSVPGGIADLASFRRWAHSARFPEFGRIDLLGDELWLDLRMEVLFSYNQVKIAIYRVLAALVDSERLGYFLPDGMRITYPGASTSVEPDGAYVAFEAMRSGRVRKHRGRRGAMELVGQPDLVIEVVSDSSQEKDYKNLPAYYAEAGIAECWRADVRKEAKFEILRLSKRGYLPVAKRRGWQRSKTFDRSFRLVGRPDPLGQTAYSLEVRR